MTQTQEGFINYPSAGSPLGHDYLLLVNGFDDNQDGYIDNGWDGFDNNGNGQIDEAAEWETEQWRGCFAAGLANAAYSIRRRPTQAQGARTVSMPSSMVIDAVRSNLPTSTTDLVVTPAGLWSPSLPYGVPTSISLGGSWFQFWLAERSDVQPLKPDGTVIATTPQGSWWLISLNCRTGRTWRLEFPDLTSGLAQARQE